MYCIECEEITAILNDPRTPPLELGDCLCINCYCIAAQEVIIEILEPLKEISLNIAILVLDTTKKGL